MCIQTKGHTFACASPLISAASRMIRCSASLLIVLSFATSGASDLSFVLSIDSTTVSYSARGELVPEERYYG